MDFIASTSILTTCGNVENVATKSPLTLLVERLLRPVQEE